MMTRIKKIDAGCYDVYVDGFRIGTAERAERFFEDARHPDKGMWCAVIDDNTGHQCEVVVTRRFAVDVIAGYYYMRLLEGYEPANRTEPLAGKKYYFTDWHKVGAGATIFNSIPSDTDDKRRYFVTVKSRYTHETVMIAEVAPKQLLDFGKRMGSKWDYSITDFRVLPAGERLWGWGRFGQQIFVTTTGQAEWVGTTKCRLCLEEAIDNNLCNACRDEL